MSILGQSVNVAASVAFANLFKKKKIPEQKKIESRPKIKPDLKSPATIGDLECDAVIEREINFESSVTENPVEDGFAVADHVTRQPIKLNLTVIFTPTPVTWFKEGTNYQNRLNEVLNSLQKIYQKITPQFYCQLYLSLSKSIFFSANLKVHW